MSTDRRLAVGIAVCPTALSYEPTPSFLAFGGILRSHLVPFQFLPKVSALANILDSLDTPPLLESADGDA
jgi:hypothetical protein